MNGLVHIYCGDGKGKTTAALGLALRAAGNGVPVVIARFLKNDGSGEVGILENVPGVYLFPCERQFGFTWTMSEAQKVEAGEYFTGLFERAWELGCKTARDEGEGAGKAVGNVSGENRGSDSVSAGSSRRDTGVCGTGPPFLGPPFLPPPRFWVKRFWSPHFWVPRFWVPRLWVPRLHTPRLRAPYLPAL